jgi:hypothetical protein
LQRLLSTALVLGLLIATAAAFAITEGLKLTKSPILNVRVVMAQFSPLCRCSHARAVFAFSLRRADDITLDVVDAHRNRVARLVDGRFAHARWNTFSWDGRDDAGALVRDGTYRFQVKLARQRRTILFPNPFRLDTKPPSVVAARALHPTISPDGDGQSDSTKIAYRLSEPAHAILYVRGRRLTFTRFERTRDALTWYGNAAPGGPSLPAGTYRLQLGAQDVAGNVTPPKDRTTVVVHVRYIALRHGRIVVTAATRFGVGVDRDAKSYDWRLGARTGHSRAHTLVVRAPRAPGRYRLVVTEDGHAAAATVIVRPRG